MRKNWPVFNKSMEYSLDYIKQPRVLDDWYILEKNYEAVRNKPIGEAKIPRVIHQIWIGGNMPQQETDACTQVREWCKLNQWEYVLWTERDINKITNFKNLDLWNLTPNLGQKSDILRNEILYEHGGVYLDTDFLMKGSFDELVDLDFFCGICYDDWPSMANGAMGSIPGGNTVTLMQTYDLPIKWHDGMAIINTTGPYHTTRKVMETACEDVVALPNSFFYPYPNFARYRSIGNNPHAYVKPETVALHLWASSWM